MKYLIYPLFAISLLLFAGCAGNSSPEEEAPDMELTVEGISDTHWTYISLETNRKVGVSPLDDPEGDEEWRNRTDWDIALCGDMIKTNSGASGAGDGGITRLDDTPYDQVTSASGVTLDTDRVFW
ncbi:MAG: HmuY family protein [Muribaculaceae bacterium]|nr:HmuY family protein [Muribaculaceae bacterium]MDE7110268.1 HmuY family protein [Muribaculaceae bacterium]